jgi:hypothetical protein
MLCIFRRSKMSNDNNNKREKIEQIPKKEKLGEVQKAVSEQGGVEGQRKEVNVGDYVKTAAIGQLLKDLEFPADKKKIIQFIQQCSKQPPNITKEQKEDIMYILQKYIEEGKHYQNVSEVTRASGLIQ